MRASVSESAEWLEPDGLGGFATGTAAGIRTRRYHALLTCARTPPTSRVTLVNGLDAWLETGAGSFALSSQRYLPGVVHPDGAGRIVAFAAEPWPTWRLRLEDGTEVVQEIFVPHGVPAAVVTWRLLRSGGGPRSVLTMRPHLSGREIHSLHHENPVFRFEPGTQGAARVWHPYDGVPGVAVWTNGEYSHAPLWYRGFLYVEERARGLDDSEDLASPGVFRWDLTRGDAVWICGMAGAEHPDIAPAEGVERFLDGVRVTERKRRAGFPSRLHRAAAAYVVRRGEGSTIVAGYPWFTDWGRDTFVALRGLCLATDRLAAAGRILLAWAAELSDGMLPNFFPEAGRAPEFNSVDASLWYIVAVHDYLLASRRVQREVPGAEARTLSSTVEGILNGYCAGTRFGIRMDADGLLAAGEPGVQLTWMDARVDDWMVTPRAGKAVEVQALWLNALRIGSVLSPGWGRLHRRGTRAFRRRFWNADDHCLYDVVDVDHQPGRVDASFRPNQVFAVGGLPYPVLEGERARAVVDAVEARLLTPLGLRSLAPGEPGYAARYQGGPRERDGAYHQGTVWPWLMGAFVEAWVRVRGRTPDAVREAKSRFRDPVRRHLDEAGLAHVSEIADAEAPHTPRGAPFQAWSVGEMLRLTDALGVTETGSDEPGAERGSVPGRPDLRSMEQRLAIGRVAG
jgi:predicted glycogen debranching enzyme